MLNRLAPNFTLAALDNTPHTLSDYRGQKVVLVFLRYWGWLPCREHVVQLHHQQSALIAQNAQVVLVCFGNMTGAQAWLAAQHITFPLLIDDTGQVYRAYGLGKSWRGLLGPKALWYYLRRGRLSKVRANPFQLGGDFIIDGAGVVRFAQRSQDPTDRPSVEQVLAALAQVT